MYHARIQPESALFSERPRLASPTAVVPVTARLGKPSLATDQSPCPEICILEPHDEQRRTQLDHPPLASERLGSSRMGRDERATRDDTLAGWHWRRRPRDSGVAPTQLDRLGPCGPGR